MKNYKMIPFSFIYMINTKSIPLHQTDLYRLQFSQASIYYPIDKNMIIELIDLIEKLFNGKSYILSIFINKLLKKLPPSNPMHLLNIDQSPHNCLKPNSQSTHLPDTNLPRSLSPRQEVLLHLQKKKNHKSKTYNVINQHSKIHQLKENSSKKLPPLNFQSPYGLNPTKQQPKNTSLFSNISNIKATNFNSVELKTIKSKSISTYPLHPPQNQSRNKPTIKSPQTSKKPYQQHLVGIVETKRKSISHRVHLTVTKDKENNINKGNDIKGNSNFQPQTSSIHEETYQVGLKNEQKREFPHIEEEMTGKLVPNRQKSCHSFMIRKKIHSTALQTQRPQQTSKQTQQCSKNYRKEKFSREESHLGMGNPQQKQVDEQYQLSGNKKLQKQLPRQQLRIESKIVVPQSHTSNVGMSLKMRKNRYSQIPERFVYEQFSTQPNTYQTKKQIPSEYRSTIDDFLQMKQVHMLQKQGLVDTNQSHRQKKHSRYTSNQESNHEPFTQMNRLSQIYSQLTQQQPYQKAAPFMQIDEEKPSTQNEKYPTNHKEKVFRKRGSSIRALRNFCRNVSDEEKPEALTQSKLAQNNKKKQKQTTCLTHKIKWGTQTRKKSSSLRGIEMMNNLCSQPHVIDESQSKKQQVSGQSKQKKVKKLRFSQQLQDIDFDSPYKKGVLKTISRKNSLDGIQKTLSIEPAHTIGSRSLVVFDDPGISVIVRNESSLQCSLMNPAYNTIQNEFRQELNYGQMTDKIYRKSKGSQNFRLQSLRQIFQQLKSHKSIYIPEDVEDEK